MKKQIIIAIICIFSISIYSQNFEGNIKFKMTSSEGSIIAEYLVKDEFYKMKIIDFKNASGKSTEDMNMENNEIIFDTKNNMMYIIMPSQKMYMEMDLKNIPNEKTSSAVKKTKFDVKKTGEKKKILGYDCEKFIITTEEGIIETWITKDINFIFQNMDKMFQSGQSFDFEKYSKDLGYPMTMKFVGKDKTTVELETIEITKKKLDKSLFLIPKGYQKFNLPTMPGNIPMK